MRVWRVGHASTYRELDEMQRFDFDCYSRFDSRIQRLKTGFDCVFRDDMTSHTSYPHMEVWTLNMGLDY